MRQCPFCAEEIQDAAVVCKHCGRELAPMLTATPASPQRAVLSRQRLFILAIVGVGLLIAFGVFLQVAAPSAPSLRGSTRINGESLTLTNEDTRAWTALHLRINTDYVSSLPALRVGQSIRIPVRQFATRSGVRFDPLTTKAMRLYVRADVDASGTQADAGWSFR